MSLNHLILHGTQYPLDVEVKNLLVDDLLQVSTIAVNNMEVIDTLTAHNTNTQSLHIEQIPVYPWKVEEQPSENTPTLKFYQLFKLGDVQYVRLKGGLTGGSTEGSGYYFFGELVNLPSELQSVYSFDTTKAFFISGNGVLFQNGQPKISSLDSLDAEVSAEGVKRLRLTYWANAGIVPEYSYTYKVSYDIIYPVVAA